jgi:hypothetical protein
MFEEFAKKKFTDYIAFIEFSENKTTFQNIRNSNLPPYIMNFLNCSRKTGQVSIQKESFEEVLNRAIVFNINYVIKPKSTLLKFLFGEVETRPAEFIKERLRYFQFYSYYISTIIEFINLNSPLIISIEQIESLIDEVNNKIYSEITDVEQGDSKRLNLIKLLYYFFLDLTKNNPVNIKLPKKILSVFFGDKGFSDIKARIDKFFSDEIFIQEAIELIKPPSKQNVKRKQDDIPDKKKVEEFFKRSKSDLIDPLSSESDIEQTKIHPAEEEKVTEFRQAEESDVINRMIEDKQFIKEELHAEELLVTPQDESEPPEIITEEQKRLNVLNKLFCEQSYRRKIIRKVFHHDEKLFNETVLKLLGVSDWKNAITMIEEYFDSNKISYFTEEAVKFVDVMQTHFSESDRLSASGQGNQNS